MNIENVVNGLECCTERDKCDKKCPYWNSDKSCWINLKKDALALLKAQEPRVLALGDIHRGMAVWLEDVDKADVILAIGGSSAGGCKCFITIDDRSIAPHDSDYGERWRCWTSRPTDEQREAIPWNAQK